MDLYDTHTQLTIYCSLYLLVMVVAAVVDTVLYCTVLYCTVLYFTLLYNSVAVNYYYNSLCSFGYKNRFPRRTAAKLSV
jgi:hypothetical protein